MDIAVRFGPFEVYPSLNLVIGPDGEQTIEPKMMQVLVLLIERGGEVVSREEILEEVWPDTFVGDEVVYRSISELRKTLGDNSTYPRYLATVPRKGYRWLAGDGTGHQSSGEMANAAGRPLWRRVFVPAAVLLIVLSILLVSVREKTERGSFEEPVTVLIAQSTGSAGENLGRILHQGLESKLGQSPRIRILAPERISEMLRLMRLGPSTPVTVEVGREVCLREGKANVLVEARLDRERDRLILRTQLINPDSGDVISAHREESPEADLADAIQRLADTVRDAVEKLDQSQLTKRVGLEAATTDSLEALRLYSKAMSFGYEWEWGPAERLLNRALEEDPDFASAYIMLAWATRNQIHPRERLTRLDEYSGFAQKALGLSSALPDAERFWIEGSYHHLRGEIDESVAPYQALVSLHPEHLWATHNLSIHFQTRVHHTAWNGMLDSAVKYMKAETDLLPTDTFQNLSSAEFLAFRLGSLEEAEPYVRRVVQLLSSANEKGPEWVRFFPELLELYQQNDPHPLVAALEEARSEASGSDAANLGFAFLDLGKVTRAEALYALEADLGRRLRLFSFAHYVKGEGEKLRKSLAEWYSDPDHLKQAQPMVVVLFALAGYSQEAQTLLERIPPSPYSALDWNDAATGAIQIGLGNFEEGRRLIERALECPLNDMIFLMSAELLARGWEERGSPEEAIRVLERALQRRFIVGSGAAAQWPLWERLLRLYIQSGETDKRLELAGRIRKSLAIADPGHPLLRAVVAVEEATHLEDQ
ncbi:MAG: winged helix-turn-helix domain-containing protein [Acidobacteriota bacterium]|nr:MAG: winged helix-turn-helix domain-containing protein [Acidobacteriota bacterium]